jgi:hypothetical protein
MAKLLKFALDRQRYDLAAYALVYGLVKTMENGKKEHRKKQKTRLLRTGT